MKGHYIPAQQSHADAPRITVELTNICNLRCSYCMRDEDALYHSPAQYFPVDLMKKIARDARDLYGFRHVSFTGGEATLHPKFEQIIESVVDEGLDFSFVTNGWHFERVYPLLLRHRKSVKVVAFSLDGTTRETHDQWRGEGSFIRVMRAVTRCYASDIPFIFKVGIRRDTVSQLQDFALLAARLGAKGLHFSHFLPTSPEFDRESALTFEERTLAEQEIAILTKIFRIEIGLAAGYYNINPEPPCAILQGTNCNIDYRGQLTLCCNISGYRGADAETDVVADLNGEDFATAYPRLRQMADQQLERRRKALAEHAEKGQTVDLYLGSPCLFCLSSFNKIPWHPSQKSSIQTRSLPVFNSAIDVNNRDSRSAGSCK